MSTRRAKQKQQQQLMIIGGGALAAVVVAAVAIFLISSGANVDVCAVDDESCYGEYIGVEQGFTEEGFAYIGSPDAPIMIGEVSDFACPHCVDYHPTLKRLINDFAKTGQARFVYMPVNWTGGNNSNVAAQAAYCAGEQNAFWQFHDELFELSDNEGPNSFDRDTLLSIAGDMGLDTDAMEQCMNNSRSRRAVSEAINIAQRSGVTGTPSILVSYDGGNTWQRLSNRDYSSVGAEILAAQPATSSDEE